MTKVKTLNLDTFEPVIGEKDVDFDVEDVDSAGKSANEVDSSKVTPAPALFINIIINLRLDVELENVLGVIESLYTS